MRSLPALLVALLLMLVLQPLALGEATPEEATAAPLAPCSVPQQFRFLEGAGLSCIDGDTWNILLDNGKIIPTHGPDPAPAEDDGTGTFQTTDPSWREPARMASCVDDPTTQHHGRILFTHPAGLPDTSANLEATVRLMFYLSNGFVRGAAEASGYASSFRMHCSAPGTPSVTVLELATSGTQDTFWSIVNDVIAQGHYDPLAKYWIFHTDRIACGGCSGWAEIWGDDSDSVDNRNHEGPSYAVTFGYRDMLTFLHEATHNLGGVQMSAPHTSGGWHCNDGYDIMCYADGGSSSAYSTSHCIGRYHYDCGGDDYFHPAPEPGSYLDTHWNVAHAYRYIDLVPLVALPSQPERPVALPASTDSLLLTWQPPSADGGAPIEGYAVYRGHCLVRGLDKGDLPTFLKVVDEGTFTYDTPPGPGPWVYRVSAITATGEGALSEPIFGAIAGAPTTAHRNCATASSV